MSSPRAARSSGTAELCVRARFSRSGSRKAYPSRSINRSSSPRTMSSVRSPCRGTERLLGRAQLRGGHFFCFVCAGLACGLQGTRDGGALSERANRIIEMRSLLVRDAQPEQIHGIGKGIQFDSLFEIWNRLRILLTTEDDNTAPILSKISHTAFI